MQANAKFPGSKIPGPSSIIAISGLAGSGKNTVGSKVAEKLGWRIVDPTFKTLAEEEGITLMQFQQKAKDDPSIDRKFDQELQKQCMGGKCVVVTWLGPWMAPGSPFRVWLEADESLRAKRLANRDGVGLGEALEHIRKRDFENRERYKKLYGIDIFDHAGFDLIIKCSESQKPEEIAQKIIDAYKKEKIKDEN